jgi:hypothetical protein
LLNEMDTVCTYQDNGACNRAAADCGENQKSSAGVSLERQRDGPQPLPVGVVDLLAGAILRANDFLLPDRVAVLYKQARRFIRDVRRKISEAAP